MYTRASASDYDDWEKLYENPGWSFNDLEPLFAKVPPGVHFCDHLLTGPHRQTETYELDPSASGHGASGPLKVSYGGQYARDHVVVFSQFSQVTSGKRVCSSSMPSPPTVKTRPSSKTHKTSRPTMHVVCVGPLLFLPSLKASENSNGPSRWRFDRRVLTFMSATQMDRFQDRTALRYGTWIRLQQAGQYKLEDRSRQLRIPCSIRVCVAPLLDVATSR